MQIKPFVWSMLLVSGVWVTALLAQRAPVRSDLKGEYLGQPTPGDAPVVFARGIVTTDDKEHWAPRFSPDGNEVFWWSIRQDRDDKWLEFHRTMRRVGGRWMAPEASPFDAAPIYAPDGDRLYFGSRKEGEDPSYVERQGQGWSQPKRIPLVSRYPEVRHAYYPSITRSGTLYFMGHLEGQWAQLGIYRAELVRGEYAKPQLMPPGVNSLKGERNWTPYVAPDESYLIFSSTRGLPATDQGDLFVCFRRADGTWTDPVSLGEPVNSKELERFPAVSPDGRYLFYTRDTNMPGYVFDEDVYWVSARIIHTLRARVMEQEHLTRLKE